MNSKIITWNFFSQMSLLQVIKSKEKLGGMKISRISHPYPSPSSEPAPVRASLRFLQGCGFSHMEISSTLFLAEQLLPCLKFCGAEEAGYLRALGVFWAHCLVVDESCPLRFWFDRLFNSYCNDIADLNRALGLLLSRWIKNSLA